MFLLAHASGCLSRASGSPTQFGALFPVRRGSPDSAVEADRRSPVRHCGVQSCPLPIRASGDLRSRFVARSETHWYLLNFPGCISVSRLSSTLKALRSAAQTSEVSCQVVTEINLRIGEFCLRSCSMYFCSL
jgi:hypothetical protein